MTKATLTAILNYLNGETVTNLDEIKAELLKELNRNAEKAQANRAMYERAKEVVFAALSDTPVTIGELFAEIRNELPDGFTQGKLQYAMTRMWNTEVIKVDGRPNGYKRA